MWKTRFLGQEDYQHNESATPHIGVLLTNLGTPEAATESAVRTYLAEFLSDPRVVEVPRLIWKLVLHGFILRRRPAKSAEAYEKVWTEQGSPLMTISQSQAQLLEKELQRRFSGPIKVKLAMRYGQPAVHNTLQSMMKAGARRVIVLPMYPQYSGSTSGSVFDAVSASLQKSRWVPDFRFINQYVDEPGYIKALANSVKEHWEKNGKSEKLVLSYHGIPKRYRTQGDPYFCQCMKTSRLLTDALNLSKDEHMTVFQSRFGREEWLQPYCDKTLEKLPAEGVKSIDIICPGFSADCLETLEEINQENREIFIDAGGENYAYIPCLNDREDHIRMLADLIVKNTQGWPEANRDYQLNDASQTLKLAKALGAEQ